MSMLVPEITSNADLARWVSDRASDAKQEGNLLRADVFSEVAKRLAEMQCAADIVEAHACGECDNHKLVAAKIRGATV